MGVDRQPKGLLEVQTCDVFPNVDGNWKLGMKTCHDHAKSVYGFGSTNMDRFDACMLQEEGHDCNLSLHHPISKSWRVHDCSWTDM